MVSKSKTIIFMALTVGIAATNILEDTISFVIKEFQINQPIIENKLLSKNSFIDLMKKLSSSGHSTGFCEKKKSPSISVLHHLYPNKKFQLDISNESCSTSGI